MLETIQNRLIQWAQGSLVNIIQNKLIKWVKCC